MPFEIALSPARANTLRAQGWWRDKTINACFDQVLERSPDKTALVAHTRGNEATRRISYRELDRLVARSRLIAGCWTLAVAARLAFSRASYLR